MATVTGKTSWKIDELIEATIVGGHVSGSGDLILEAAGGAEILAGSVAGDDFTSLWSDATAYSTGDVAGYAGRIWKAISSGTNKPPAFYNSYWLPLTAGDINAWADLDGGMDGDEDDIFWDFTTHTGTVGHLYSNTAGHFEHGRQGLRLNFAADTSQRIYAKCENVIKGAEVLSVSVRCKASTGVTLDVSLLQNTIDQVPNLGATGLSETAAAEGQKAVGTSFATYNFTLTAVDAKPRGRVNLVFANPGAGADNVFIDSIRVQRVSGQGLAAWPVGSVYTAVDNVSPALRFGGGTWSVFATGRMLIGVDTGDAAMNTPEETGGAKTHVLEATNMATHVHNMTHSHTINTRNAPEGTNTGAVTSSSGASTVNTGNTAPNGFTGDTTDGGSQLHQTPVDHMNPYITVYMWKRTA